MRWRKFWRGSRRGSVAFGPTAAGAMFTALKAGVRYLSVNQAQESTMPDAFANRMRRPTDPAVTLFDITPDDGADLAQVTIALNVATPGTVRLTTLDNSVTDVTIWPGHAFPVRAKRVWQTGTSATGIRGLA